MNIGFKYEKDTKMPSAHLLRTAVSLKSQCNSPLVRLSLTVWNNLRLLDKLALCGHDIGRLRTLALNNRLRTRQLGTELRMMERLNYEALLRHNLAMMSALAVASLDLLR